MDFGVRCSDGAGEVKEDDDEACFEGVTVGLLLEAFPGVVEGFATRRFRSEPLRGVFDALITDLLGGDWLWLLLPLLWCSLSTLLAVVLSMECGSATPKAAAAAVVQS